MNRLFEYLAVSALYLACVGAAVRFGFQAIEGGSEPFAIFVFSGTSAAFLAYHLLNRFGDGIFNNQKEEG